MFVLKLSGIQKRIICPEAKMTHLLVNISNNISKILTNVVSITN